MKGIFAVRKGELGVLDIPDPKPGPFEALVRVKACGLCNSTDWKLLEGEFFPGSFPILLGHEALGEVIDLGEGVKNFRLGDHVLRGRLEHEHLGIEGGRSLWGGFAEKVLVTDVWARKGVAYGVFPHPQQIVPRDIPAPQGAALINLKETLSCLQRTEVQPGQSLAIVGTGPVAQALALMAQLQGIRPTVVFGRRTEAARAFEQFGLAAFVTGDALPSAAEDLMKRGGFDRVIEAVGSRDALRTCLRIAAKNGRINIYGVTPESEPHDAEDARDPRVFRSDVVEAEAHEQMLEWVRAGDVRLTDWFSHIMPWTEAQRAFDMVRGKVANRIILNFE